MAEHDVEQIWHDFWVPVIDKATEGQPMRGFISLPFEAFEQIKRELFDYHQLLHKLPKFYDDITGGKASKPNTDLDVVAELAREHIFDEVKWRVEEELEVRQIEADEDAWQRGYDSGYEDGRDRGFEDGLEDARRRI